MNIGKNAEWKSIQFETCLWLLKRQSAIFVRMFILLRFKIIKSRLILKENIIRTLKHFNRAHDATKAEIYKISKIRGCLYMRV